MKDFKLKITAGKLKSRLLSFDKNNLIRPTKSYIRELIFNVVKINETTKCLDLFAGSGILSAEAYSRGAKIILIADKNCIKKASFAHYKIEIPNFENDFKSLLSPFLMAIPAQLLAYHVANERGTDVDQPRNLAKSVTVE